MRPETTAAIVAALDDLYDEVEAGLDVSPEVRAALARLAGAVARNDARIIEPPLEHA